LLKLPHKKIPRKTGSTQIVLKKIIGDTDEIRRISGFSLWRWLCAERELEQR